MADVYSIEKTTLDAIANSVRGKTGRTELLDPEDIPGEINSLVAGGMKVPTENLPINANGDYPVTDYASVSVNVPVPDGYYQPSGSVRTAQKNNKYYPTYGTGSTAASGKFVSQILTAIPLEDKTVAGNTITANGTYEPAEGYEGFSKVTVEIPLEDKTVEGNTITDNGTYEPAEGYEGFSKVTVEVKKTYYVYRAYTFSMKKVSDVPLPPLGLYLLPIKFVNESSDANVITMDPAYFDGLEVKEDGVYGISATGALSDGALLYSPQYGWTMKTSMGQLSADYDKASITLIVTRYNGNTTGSQYVAVPAQLYEWFKALEC